MGTYVATWNIGKAFRDAHFQALKDGSPLPEEINTPAEAHLAYVRELKAKGKAIAGGPVTSFNWALLLLKVDSLEEARAIVENDPAVKGGIFSDTKVEPWYHIV